MSVVALFDDLRLEFPDALARVFIDLGVGTASELLSQNILLLGEKGYLPQRHTRRLLRYVEIYGRRYPPVLLPEDDYPEMPLSPTSVSPKHSDEGEWARDQKLDLVLKENEQLRGDMQRLQSMMVNIERHLVTGTTSPYPQPPPPPPPGPSPHQGAHERSPREAEPPVFIPQMQPVGGHDVYHTMSPAAVKRAVAEKALDNQMLNLRSYFGIDKRRESPRGSASATRDAYLPPQNLRAINDLVAHVTENYQPKTLSPQRRPQAADMLAAEGGVRVGSNEQRDPREPPTPPRVRAALQNEGRHHDLHPREAFSTTSPRKVESAREELRRANNERLRGMSERIAAQQREIAARSVKVDEYESRAFPRHASTQGGTARTDSAPRPPSQHSTVTKSVKQDEGLPRNESAVTQASGANPTPHHSTYSSPKQGSTPASPPDQPKRQDSTYSNLSVRKESSHSSPTEQDDLEDHHVSQHDAARSPSQRDAEQACDARSPSHHQSVASQQISRHDSASKASRHESAHSPSQHHSTTSHVSRQERAHSTQSPRNHQSAASQHISRHDSASNVVQESARSPSHHHSNADLVSRHESVRSVSPPRPEDAPSMSRQDSLPSPRQHASKASRTTHSDSGAHSRQPTRESLRQHDSLSQLSRHDSGQPFQPQQSTASKLSRQESAHSPSQHHSHVSRQERAHSTQSPRNHQSAASQQLSRHDSASKASRHESAHSPSQHHSTTSHVSRQERAHSTQSPRNHQSAASQQISRHDSARLPSQHHSAASMVSRHDSMHTTHSVSPSRHDSTHSMPRHDSTAGHSRHPSRHDSRKLPTKHSSAHHTSHTSHSNQAALRQDSGHSRQSEGRPSQVSPRSVPSALPRHASTSQGILRHESTQSTHISPKRNVSIASQPFHQVSPHEITTTDSMSRHDTGRSALYSPRQQQRTSSHISQLASRRASAHSSAPHAATSQAEQGNEGSSFPAAIPSVSCFDSVHHASNPPSRQGSAFRPASHSSVTSNTPAEPVLPRSRGSHDDTSGASGGGQPRGGSPRMQRMESEAMLGDSLKSPRGSMRRPPSEGGAVGLAARRQQSGDASHPMVRISHPTTSSVASAPRDPYSAHSTQSALLRIERRASRTSQQQQQQQQPADGDLAVKNMEARLEQRRHEVNASRQSLQSTLSSQGSDTADRL